MKTQSRSLLYAATLLSIFLLAACGTASTPIPSPTPEKLSVDVTPAAFPQVVHQAPLPGERLGLSPEIQVSFDRPMDQAKTESAWAFLDSDGNPVAGKISWISSQTLQFKPDKALKPAGNYSVVISSAASAADGTSLPQNIKLDYQTTNELVVNQVFPADQAVDVDSQTAITVIFNKPVVPLMSREDQAKLPGPVEITPALTGSGEWVSSSVYVFKPEKGLNSGTTYQLHVRSGLKDTTGVELKEDLIAKFTTSAPGVIDFELKNQGKDFSDSIDSVLLDQAFILTFNRPMDPKSVSQGLLLSNIETGTKFPVKLTWDDKSVKLTVTPVGRYSIGSFYDLAIDTTGRAQDGGTLKEPYHVKLSTVSLPGIESVSPDSGKQKNFSSYLRISFRTPMNPDSLKDKVKILPEPTKPFKFITGPRSLAVYGLQPSTAYVVRIMPGMADIYGNTIKDGQSLSFETAALQPYAHMGTPSYALIYRPQGEKTLFFDYTNLISARLSLYSIPFDDFSISLNDYDALKAMGDRQTSPLREWDLKLTAAKDQFGRIPINLDDGGQLKAGYYFVRLTSKPQSTGLGKQGTDDYSTVSFTGSSKRGGGGNVQDALFIVASDNITLKTTPSEALAWLVDQETGQPTPNVPLVFYDEKWNIVGRASTDANGLAYVSDASNALYVRTDDPQHLAMTATNWGSGVYPGQFGIWTDYYTPPTNAFADIYTDRALYRPGQAVEYKGILRTNDDLHYSLPTQKNINVRIENDQGKVFEGDLPVSKNGTFSGEFSVGADAPVGNYYVSVRNAAGDENMIGSGSFRVAEYRKPQFEVTMAAVPDTVLAGEQVTYSLDANYYSGGNVSNATVEWFMEAQPYLYPAPAKYSQYRFDNFDFFNDYFSGADASKGNPLTQQGKGVTDEKGHFELTQAAQLQKQNVSQQILFSANVSDVGGSLVGGHASMVVLASAVHAGVRAEDYVGEKGKPQTFDLVVLDLNGKPLAKQVVSVDFAEQRWYSVIKTDDKGVSNWETSVKSIPAGSASATTDENGLATVTFTPPNGGEYKAIATAKDDKGRPSKASTYLWVSSQAYVPWKQTNDRSFDLVLDKDSYNPGETAKILIAQPFEGENYALVTLERGHIYEKKVIKLETNSSIYELPITKEMAPVMYVSVVVVKGADGKIPANFKVGMVRVNVNPSQQQINVSLESDKQDAKPGDIVTYTVTTKDLAGKPVQADVSLALVDKAVLALAPSNSAPLLATFYPERGLSVVTASGIVLNAEDFNANFQESMPTGEQSGSGGGGEKGEGAGIITVRENFKDTAFWQAQVLTDDKGSAQVKVTLPDNLTTWQMDARAVTDDTRVGEATHELVSNRPMYVDLQTPRFFVVDDKVRIGAVVHNNTGAALTATVTLKAEGVTLQSDATQTVDVPSKQQAYVTWDVTVKPDAKRVDLTAEATGGSYSDSTRPTLATLPDNGIPVLTYHVTETVGSSGVLRGAGSATESVLLPQSLGYLDATLTVEASPSLAASMTDSLTYLKDYPYLCMEQTVSRFLPNLISVRALALAGKSSSDLQKSLDEQVRPALQRINNNQNSDGGWGLWPGNDTQPTTTAYVILGLVEARESGYTVSDDVLQKGLTYLNDNLPTITQEMDGWQKNQAAFMLYALARGGQPNPGKLTELLSYDNNLGLYARAFLLQSMFLTDAKDSRIQDLLSTLNNAAAKSAAGAWWNEKETDYWNWNTDVRTTAIVLNTLIQVDPNNPLIADGVRWLMKHRDGNHWYSTQETAWSLMTLTNWLSLSKEFETNYSYALGLNGNLLESKLASKDNLLDTTLLKMGVEKMLSDQTNYLVLTRGDGPGVLYYTAYMDYSLPVKDIQPLDQGILVTRQYFPVDNPKTPISEVQRGDLVQVRLTLVVPDSLHYLVLDDPLPAGLEAVDSSLQTSTQVPETYQPNDYERYGWGWWYFYYKQIYDDKLVMSADYLPAGMYTITYIARASSAGEFRVLPVTAKEFYFPDVSGRSAGSVFTVKP